MHSEAMPNSGPCAKKTKSEKLRDSTNNRRRCGMSFRSGSTCCGSSLSARRNASLPETVAARYCSPSSMEVNDRVMTVLCSSASRSFRSDLLREFAQCATERIIARDGCRKILQSQQHGSERSRHDRALLVGVEKLQI